MKQTLSFGLAFLGLALVAPAQELVTADTQAAARQRITAAKLKGHTRFLAGDLGKVAVNRHRLCAELL